MWLNILGILIAGFVILFTTLFVIVCAFEKFMDGHFDLEDNNK